VFAGAEDANKNNVVGPGHSVYQSIFIGNGFATLRANDQWVYPPADYGWQLIQYTEPISQNPHLKKKNKNTVVLILVVETERRVPLLLGSHDGGYPSLRNPDVVYGSSAEPKAGEDYLSHEPIEILPKKLSYTLFVE